jgi:hypothetical protein
VLLGALMAMCVGLPTASAQDDGFALEQFEPRPAGSGILNVPTSHVLEAGSFSVDLWMHYSQDPLTIDPVVEGDPRTGGAVVPDRLGLDLLVAYGVWRGLEVSLAVPLGTKPSEGDLAVGGRSPADLTGASLGDLRLAIDAAVLRMAGYDPAGFGVLVGATVYTGSRASAAPGWSRTWASTTPRSGGCGWRATSPTTSGPRRRSSTSSSTTSSSGGSAWRRRSGSRS